MKSTSCIQRLKLNRSKYMYNHNGKANCVDENDFSNGSFREDSSTYYCKRLQYTKSLMTCQQPANDRATSSTIH